MRVVNVRIGERFVLDDHGGVWERIEDKPDMQSVCAKCVFGSKDQFGKEVTVDPNAFCYVIFEEKRAQQKEPYSQKPTKVIIVEEWNDALIKEMGHMTPEQIGVLSSSDTIRVIPQGKSKPVVFLVSELAYDVDDGVLYVGVMPERDEIKDGERNDRAIKVDEKPRVVKNSRGIVRKPSRRNTSTEGDGTKT